MVEKELRVGGVCRPGLRLRAFGAMADRWDRALRAPVHRTGLQLGSISQLRSPMITSPQDTIVALATPPGESAIGIIRMSGKKSLKILKDFFTTSRKGSFSSLKERYLHKGWIVDNRKRIDEVTLVIMKGPRSYTGEDMIEVYGHGGPLILDRILGLFLKSGARIAEPGEFTKRAFLNGKIDLSRAEAVAWLIQSRSEKEAELAAAQLRGSVEERIRSIKTQLIHTLSTLEAHIDFEELECKNAPYSEIIKIAKNCRKEIEKLLRETEAGEAMKKVPEVVIVGKPNVGKSSILNRLVGQNRAIVTPYPGTTRDIIEETIRISGMPVSIIDTAGIRRPRGKIEEEGVRRAKNKIKDSDLVLVVLDHGTCVSRDDIETLKTIGERKAIIVINKSDLPLRIRTDAIKHLIGGRKIISISAEENRGIDDLEKEIWKIIKSELYRDKNTGVCVSLKRRVRMKDAADSLGSAIEGMGRGYSPELIAGDIRRTLDLTIEILGERYNEEILEEIFSRFCVGK